jgi:ABC-type glutathione transport system ATPase component
VSTAGGALAVEHVEVSYRVRGRDLRVLRDVSFAVGRGESYGLVGESGCGKSTMALASGPSLLILDEPTTALDATV